MIHVVTQKKQHFQTSCVETETIVRGNYHNPGHIVRVMKYCHC